jgi:hypothetical protein
MPVGAERVMPAAAGAGSHDELGLLLQAHGIRSGAIEPTKAMAEKLRSLQREYGVEFGAMLNAETGDALEGILRGAAKEVDFTSPLGNMANDCSYVQVHTHPESLTFSPDDVRILMNHDQIRTSVVIGADGTWYLLSRQPGFMNVSRIDFDSLYDVEFMHVQAEIRDRVLQGRLQITALQPETYHEVWRRIMPYLTLRYDRWRP